jgi:hypothetical protein
MPSFCLIRRISRELAENRRPRCPRFASLEAIFGLQKTLRPLWDQPLAIHIEIDQREG